MASESTQAQSTFNSSGQQYRSVRKRGGPMSPTSVAKRFTPHHRPSSSSKLRDYGPCPLAMASSNVSPPHDSLQVVNDVIEASQIEKAVKSLEDDSAAEGIYTEFKWTGACEDLLRTYRERIHPRVCPASKGKFDSANTVYRSSPDRRLPPSSSPIRKRSERSKRLYASTPVFRRHLSAASVFRRTTTL